VTGDKLLSKIPGELLHLTRNGLPQPPPDGPDTQRVIIRLPDGRRAEVTFIKLKSKKRKDVVLVLDAEPRADSAEMKS